MPIYEYMCSECKSKFELIRSMSKANEEAACPMCGASSEKVLSKFACFSTDESGVSTAVGGSSCAGCSSGNCSTCAS